MDKAGPRQLILPLALGAKRLEDILAKRAARSPDETKTEKAVYDAVDYVIARDAESGFLHSALCAMSLPIKKPKDEFAPIVRQDGHYSLIIKPMERIELVDGKLVTRKVGVPFGIHARLVMLFIMTEAVKGRSREIFLGDSFSAFLRRMGITSPDSGGARSSRGSVLEQIDRLLACEWTIRFDSKIIASNNDDDLLSIRPAGKRGRGAKRNEGVVTTFAVNDMRIVNQYAGVSTNEGNFISRFILTESFYANLLEHSVPLNEHAFVALKASATYLDLYTYLAYRLPRIPPGETVIISWSDLEKHLGNTKQPMFKFRQIVRNAWQHVSGVYQQARNSVSFDGLRIIMRYAPCPLDGHLHQLPSGQIEETYNREQNRPSVIALENKSSSTAPASSAPLMFSKRGTIAYDDERIVRVAREHGHPHDIDLIAEAFRKVIGTDIEILEGRALLKRWESFCKSFRPR